MRSKKKKHALLKLFLLLLLALLAVGLYLRLSVGSLISTDRERQGYARTVNIMLVGADYNEVGISEGRSDSIMLLSVNLEKKKLFLLSVPRDTYAKVEGYGRTKINHSYAYGGLKLLRDSVEKLLELPIDYYMEVNFAGFEQLIDAMGGIDIEVDKDMDFQTYYDHIQLKKGFQHLGGKKALQFVRYRHDKLGDIQRVQRQQLFMQAVMQKLTSFKGVMAWPDIVATAFEIVKTDLSKADILRIGLNVITWDLSELQTGTLPGNFADIEGLSYWRMDFVKWQALAKEKIL